MYKRIGFLFDFLNHILERNHVGTNFDKKNSDSLKIIFATLGIFIISLVVLLITGDISLTTFNN